MSVNREIHEYQVKYQDFMEELKSLQGLLTLKNKSLAEEELSLEWFTIQGGVSTKKRKELSEENEHLFLQKVPIQDLHEIFNFDIKLAQKVEPLAMGWVVQSPIKIS